MYVLFTQWCGQKISIGLRQQSTTLSPTHAAAANNKHKLELVDYSVRCNV